jgi:hypothetical protein
MIFFDSVRKTKPNWRLSQNQNQTNTVLAMDKRDASEVFILYCNEFEHFLKVLKKKKSGENRLENRFNS